MDGALLGSDANGDSLTYSITTSPSLGTITITDQATGAFSYIPATDEFGSDIFNYQVNDGKGNSPIATVTIMINRPPEAQSFALRAPTGQELESSLLGSDDDGDATTFEILESPTNGELVDFDATTGDFTYKSATEFFGDDSITYVVNDGFADSVEAIVSISVDRWQGSVNLGTPGNETATYGLGIDDDDNLYFAYTSDVAVANQQSAGGTDVVLAKLDPSGAVMWQKQWGYATDEQAYQLAVGPGGFVYLTAHTRFPTSSGTSYLLKFDFDGNLVWEFEVPQPYTYTQLYRMAVATNGNVYASLNANPAAVIKVNADGTLGWIKRLGTDVDDPLDPLLSGNYDDYTVRMRGLAVDSNETLFSILEAEYTPAGTADFVRSPILVSIDSSGTIATRIEPLTASNIAFELDIPAITDLALTEAGNLRMSGYTEGQLAAAEFDLGGSEIWSITSGDPDYENYTFRATISDDGSSFTSGIRRPWDSTFEDTDMLLTRISNSGTLVWEQVFDSSPDDNSVQFEDNGGQPIIDSAGDIFVTVTSFGGSFGNTPNQGGADVFLLKIDPATGQILE